MNRALFFLLLCLSFCNKNKELAVWNEKITKVIGLSTKERFLYYSKIFIDTEYKNKPIENKIYNLNEVDCITYIHNVFALSRSNCYSEFVKNITETTLYKYNKIKTNRDLVLEKRHFTLLDYFLSKPNTNYFNIVTEEIVPEKYIKNRELTIDKKAFFEKVYKIKTDKKPTKLDIKYSDANELESYYKNLQDYLKKEKVLILILVPNEKTRQIIKNAIGSDIDAHHLGVVYLNEDDQIIFRHAALNKRVLDIDLKDYTSISLKQKLGGFIFIALNN